MDASTGQGVAKPIPKECTVGKASERVVECLMEQFGFEAGAVGDVAAVEYEPIDVGVIEQVRDGQLDVAGPGGGVPPGGHDAMDAERLGGGILERFQDGGGLVGIHQLAQGLSLELVGVVSEHSVRGHALVGDGSVGVDDGDDIGAVLDEGRESFPARREFHGSFCHAVFQVLGEPAVLSQGEDLPDDQQHHDGGARPGHEGICVAGL